MLCRGHLGALIQVNVKKSVLVAAIGLPRIEVAIEKLQHAARCIISCFAIVLQPVIKHGRARLEMPVIESLSLIHI